MGGRGESAGVRGEVRRGADGVNADVSEPPP